MGKVRADYIKNNCKEIYHYYSNEVTTDFESNKQLLMKVTDVKNKRLKNRMAGYLVIIKKKEGRIIIPPKKEKKARTKKERKKNRKRQDKKWIG